MKHTCNVSKIQKYMYGHLVKCWVSHILSKLDHKQLKFSWSDWSMHELSVGLGWVDLRSSRWASKCTCALRMSESHSSGLNGMSYLWNGWTYLIQTREVGFLMHVCLAHDQKSMSMTSDHKVRWDQLVLHPPWNWLNIDSKTLFPKQGLIFRDLQSFHCGCLSVFLFPIYV